MDSLYPLRLFLKLAQLKSFTALADLENIHPSSVSRKIEALEEEIGAKLFNRSTRSVALTKAGKIYYEKANILLEQFDELNLEVSQSFSNLKGTIKVALPVSFGRIYLAPLISKFTEHYPEIELTFISSNQASDLINEDFDLALRIGGTKDSSMISRKIALVRRVVCASPKYLSIRGTPQKPSDLKSHRCLLGSYEKKSTRWYFKRNGKSQSIDVEGPLKSDHGEILVQACKDGVGVALLPSWLIKKELESGELIQVLTLYECDIKQSGETFLQILYPNKKSLSERSRVFIDFVIAELAHVF